MGSRVGFGASVAAAILFSSLLMSNFVVLIGADQRERFAAKAEEESSLSDGAAILSGVEGLSLLDRVQTGLSSGPFPCVGLVDAMGTRLGVMAALGGEGQLAVNSTMTIGRTRGTVADPSLLWPFNGTAQGMLNFSLWTSVSGGSPTLGVSIARNGVQYLNLPVRVEAMESVCRLSATEISNSFLSLALQGCNLTLIMAAMNGLAFSLAELSGKMGFVSRFDYSVMSTGCRVDYVHMVSQVSITGPLGPFTVAAVEAGSVYLQSSP